MALGNTYNNNKSSEFKSPSVYSFYKAANPESSIDKTNLNFSMWSGLLKISIAPRKAGDQIAFDYDNAIAIHLSHTKARIFKAEIERFLADPTICTNAGVSTNKGCIYICDGKEFGSTNICLVIKLIKETGEVVSSIAYEFNKGYHYAIRNFDQNTLDFQKAVSDYDTLEILELCTMLEQYYLAATNATAYTVIEQMKYNNTKVDNRLEAIGVAVNADFKKGNGSGGYSSSSSFFNKGGNGGTTSAPKTTSYSDYDDLASEIG